MRDFIFINFFFLFFHCSGVFAASFDPEKVMRRSKEERLILRRHRELMENDPAGYMAAVETYLYKMDIPFPLVFKVMLPTLLKVDAKSAVPFMQPVSAAAEAEEFPRPFTHIHRHVQAAEKKEVNPQWYKPDSLLIAPAKWYLLLWVLLPAAFTLKYYSNWLETNPRAISDNNGKKVGDAIIDDINDTVERTAAMLQPDGPRVIVPFRTDGIRESLGGGGGAAEQN
jgi:hypothetical protein